MGENDKLPPLPGSKALNCYAETISQLEKASRSAGHTMEMDAWFSLPEYDAALYEAYALQLVHGDLSADGFDMAGIHSRPAERLGQMPLAEVRRYVHALWRCERHTYPHGSLVLDAVQSGALGIAARRLAACSTDA
ncbi:hypothetical protein [Pseudomonas sp. GV085]|uniref:hypothetical protein n=1 Tax=Pseudomonas sp. GV085 TaxID=2135756 RepID=UPI000D354DDE|nr:hypothetical protein [Pseudomonas sp. GV085]PTR29609.1 hypothetical protein C8K63_101502 [Pseudomonas sp. GV085]